MQLKTYLKKHSIDVADFAHKIGISEQAVYRYINEGRVPAPMIVNRISRATAGLVQPNDLYDASPDHRLRRKP